MAGKRYIFDEFALDPSRASLMRDGAALALRPKAFDTLKYLVENPGRIVSKDELIGSVWEGVVVTDDSLTKCIQEIREALGDRPPRYVKTVPRRGYLFDAPVTAEAADAASGTPTASPAAGTARASPAASTSPETAPATAALDSTATLPVLGASRGLALAAAAAIALIVAAYVLFGGGRTDVSDEAPSIAVLPFLNLSSDAEQEYFSDGLAEELLNKLARLEGLIVTSRTSSFVFKDSSNDIRTIAARLGVDNVVEGSVRRDGDSIRITAQLIEAENGTHLWSETYERQLEDIFAIQDDIAESIAAELSITLGIAERAKLRTGTRNLEAFDHYLSGLALLNEFGPDATERGIAELERATAIDPQYADAWALLAVAQVQNAYFVTGDFARADAEADRAARRAIALNPDLAPAHAALLAVHVLRGDWARAEQAGLTAISIPSDFNPSWDFAEFVQAAGYLEEALQYRQQVRRELAFNVAPAADLAIAYHQAGDDASAEAELERAAGLVGDPGGVVDAWSMIAMARRDDEMLRQLLVEARGAGDATAEVLAALLDDPAAAPAGLRRLRDSSADDLRARLRLAQWAAYFGEPELAVELARDQVLAGPYFIQRFWSPALREARRTSAFKALVMDVGLVDFWRVRGWPTLCRPLGDDDFECY